MNITSRSVGGREDSWKTSGSNEAGIRVREYHKLFLGSRNNVSNTPRRTSELISNTAGLQDYCSDLPETFHLPT